jgi:hypothetical protein
VSDNQEVSLEVKNALQSALDDVSDNPLTEMRLYVFEQMMELLKNVPDQFETLAVARLALIGNVTGLVQQNANLMSLVQSVCEWFGVTVRVTAYNGTQVFEQDLAIVADSRYDIKTLQQAMISLKAKINIIVSEAEAKGKLHDELNNKIINMTEETVRLQNRIKEFANAPPPLTIEKPFRLARSFIKDGQVRFLYICKDETGDQGYKVTKHLSKALAWDDAGKAAERLVHLMQNALEYPIPKIYDYNVLSLHVMNPSTKISTETQLALSQARIRAEKNLKAK